jgi:hypothetical protein
MTLKYDLLKLTFDPADSTRAYATLSVRLAQQDEPAFGPAAISITVPIPASACDGSPSGFAVAAAALVQSLLHETVLAALLQQLDATSDAPALAPPRSDG